MRHEPVRRKPPTLPPGRHALAFAAALAVLGGGVPASALRAEPITLDAADAGQRAPGVVADPVALVGTTANDPANALTAPDTAGAASGGAPPTSPAAGTGPGEAASPAAATKPPPVAVEHAAEPPRPGVPAPGTAPATAASRPPSPPAQAGDEMADEEPEWERELKEAVRPVYNELAASGVVDAVQGFKSYLASIGVIAPGERPPPAGQRAKGEAAADAREGAGEAGWETRAGSSDAPPVHPDGVSERQRMIAAMLFEQWLAAAPPWIIGGIAIVVLWQIARLGFALLRARSTRRRRRSAKSGQRSANSARTRARS